MIFSRWRPWNNPRAYVPYFASNFIPKVSASQVEIPENISSHLNTDVCVISVEIMSSWCKKRKVKKIKCWSPRLITKALRHVTDAVEICWQEKAVIEVHDNWGEILQRSFHESWCASPSRFQARQQSVSHNKHSCRSDLINPSSYSGSRIQFMGF